MLAYNQPTPRKVEIDMTRVTLSKHGVFLAPTLLVASKLSSGPKRQLVGEVRSLWPSVFTRKELDAMPAYVLAVILTQI